MFHPEYMLPAIAGTAVLVVGIFTAQREVQDRSATDWFVALGMVLFAAPLATFGTEHFVIARGIAALVPSWLPARLFIAYFVGAALIAASLSFTFRRQVRLASLLLAILFALFVSLIHVPGIFAQPGNRDFQIDALRDSAFGLSALALYLHLEGKGEGGRTSTVLRVAQLGVALVVLAFAIIQLFHPECSPGVPSLRTTPSWVPLPLILGYVTGSMLLILGLGMLYERTARVAAVAGAMWMTALTLFLYVTDALFFLPPSQGILGVNYVFDTLLFAGALLLIARTQPVVHAEASLPSAEGDLLIPEKQVPLGG